MQVWAEGVSGAEMSWGVAFGGVSSWLVGQNSWVSRLSLAIWRLVSLLDFRLCVMALQDVSRYWSSVVESAESAW